MCLVVFSICPTGEFYPVLEIKQGNVAISALGRESIDPDAGLGTCGAAYEFDLLVQPWTGYDLNDPFELELRMYFQCAYRMYYGNASFVGVSINGNESSATIDINGVVHRRSLYLQDAPTMTTDRLQVGPPHPPLLPVTVDRVPGMALGQTPMSTIFLSQRSHANASWIHLVGDSNMRHVFFRLCDACGSRSVHVAKPFSATCFCTKANVYVHYDLAWLRYTPLINNTGRLLSEIVDAEAPGSDVYDTANLTLVSLGSHSAHIPVNALRSHVFDFVGKFHRLTQGRLAVALTTAVCIEKIPEKYTFTHGTWEMLQRNNYRVLALNRLAVEACSRLQTRIVDWFSWSLSAGCQHFVDAVHMDEILYDAFAHSIANI